MKPLQDYRNLDTLTDLQAQLAQAELEREQTHGRRNLAHSLDLLIVRIKRRIRDFKQR